MRRVITYGTFDLFHDGHRRLLERAKALGDYLIVGITTENFDDARGKLNVEQSLIERMANVRRSGLADEIVVEEYEGQKVQDVQRYDVDIFAIGSDWTGKFDYLQDYCEVVYLERTHGISSTLLRTQRTGLLKLGVVGAGRIAARFVAESKYVSGVHIEGVYSRDPRRTEAFRKNHELNLAADTFTGLLANVDAVYVATPHETHAGYIRAAIEAGVHVLSEKPITLDQQETQDLFTLARKHEVVLLEALKTAFAPGFQRMVAVARSGSIGEIRSVDASFTKLEAGELRELKGEFGGSVTELASYPLLAIVKLLGISYKELQTYSYKPLEAEVDLFSRIDLVYDTAIASARVGLGVKVEGDLVVGGTSGYIYVPAPWWKTEYFETRFEDPAQNKKFYYKFDGDGLRYEIAEFASMVKEKRMETFKLRPEESIAISGIIDSARRRSVTFG